MQVRFKLHSNVGWSAVNRGDDCAIKHHSFNVSLGKVLTIFLLSAAHVIKECCDRHNGNSKAHLSKSQLYRWHKLLWYNRYESFSVVIEQKYVMNYPT